MKMENLSSELAAFLREEVGIVPAKGEAKFPTREQALAKGFYNTMNLTKEEDGSWTPDF
jgi:hypothetical protein